MAWPIKITGALESANGFPTRENICPPTIFITGEHDRNDGPISSSYLRKIRDLKKVLIRNIDHQRRTRAADNLGLERTGKCKACRNQYYQGDHPSDSDRFHTSRNTRCPRGSKLEIAFAQYAQDDNLVAGNCVERA